MKYVKTIKYIIFSFSSDQSVRWYWNQDTEEWSRLNRATIYPDRKAAEKGRESTPNLDCYTRYIITLDRALVQEIMTS